MINIPEIYNDPILFRNRRGDEFSPYVSMKESVVINKGRAVLSEQPNKFDKVKVIGLGRDFHETIDGTLDENTYRVSYLEGAVYFHGSLEGRTLTFEYTGQGVHLYPDSRIYLTDEDEFPTIRDKFKDVDRAILVERQRINEHIISHPQPSEVVDIRVDYNGKVFPVAKERIDAEQKKIEEAYVDAFGKRHSSLKKRIDSMQLAVEESIGDIEDEQIRLDGQIKVVPGQINLKVSELRKEVDGELVLMQSEIDMLPELISLEVSELREEIDGQIANTRSMINILAGEIDLKVDHNGVVSSINLSKEGVRISGKKLWLDGETRIDNAVIKSAHIDSIAADKIKTGTLSAINISGVTIEGSLIRGTNIYVDGDKPEFLYSNAIDTNPETRGVHIYIRPTADGEVRTTKTHTRDEYVPIRTLAMKSPTGKNAHIATDGELRVRNLSLGSVGTYRDVRAKVFHGTAIDLNNRSDGINMYVRPSSTGEVRITRRGTTDRYRPIAASDFRIRSSKSSKENIAPTTKSGLRVTRKLDVVDFNYKGEAETKIGLIAEDSKDINSCDKEFVETSKLMMYLLLSIQELDRDLNELKKQVQS